MFNEYFNQFPVKVTWGTIEFQILQCFENSSQPKVMTSYAFPKFGISMAIIRYKGVCIETGYEKDTLLIRKTSYEVSENKIENNDDKLLIIILLVIVTGLMIYVFLKKKKRYNLK